MQIKLFVATIKRGDDLSPRQNEYREQNLQDQDRRHPVHKVPVPGLVAEHAHAKDRTDASAEEGDEKERGLPDAPEMPDRLSLVDAHHGEAGQIDHGEI